MPVDGEESRQLRAFYHTMRRFCQPTALPEPPGMTRVEFFVMEALCRAEEAEEETGVSALARELHCAPPGISRLLGQLEGRGLIRREVDRRDRRAARVVVTPQGREAARRGQEAHRAFFCRVRAAMGAEEMETFLTLWGRLTDIMEAEGNKGGEQT